MRILKELMKLLFLSLAVLSLVSQASAQETDNKGNAAKSEGAEKRGAKQEAAARGYGDSAVQCPSRMPREYFFVDFSGSISNTGRTYEGPLCIVVFHNPVQQFIGLQTATTTANGPDLSKVVLGGSAAGGIPPKLTEKKPTNLSDAMAQLYEQVSKLKTDLGDRRKDYRDAAQAEDQAISRISLLRQTTALLGGDDAIARVRSGYEALHGDLQTALLKATFVPSDHADKIGDLLLADAESQVDRLNALPLEYVEGAPASFECNTTNVQIGWSAWIAKCKDSVYTPLKAMIDSNLQAAKDLASDSDNVKALVKKIAIAQYWDTLFSTLGLRTNLLNADIEALDISPFFYTRTAVRCGILFNQTSNTAVNIVTADLTPTLQGNEPAIKAQNPFVTVSCGTAFAVSAGVGFHGIEQKQFAIVQSPDGKGGVINTFGTTSDSKVTPVALALVHVRLSEWDRHKFAFYGTLGVGGSLQNQSNSSPVQFLPGVSVSFWRTMYLTVGPEIGNQTSLTGGFKLGDTVPSGVTSINNVTQTSHTVGFGLAISFTKP